MKTKTSKKYQAREQWLADAMQAMRSMFKAAGYTIPQNVRVSCGLPSKGAFSMKKRRIGEAWASQASKDQHFEIFISPTLDDQGEVLAVLVHEIVHVTVGLKEGHKGEFVKCASKIGLQGPWTATTATKPLADELKKLAAKLGKYPHGSLEHMTNGRKKQPTRLVKVECPCCGYKARITMQWILLGVPQCPNTECDQHGDEMTVAMPA